MNEVIRCLVERRSCKCYQAKQVPEETLEQVLLREPTRPTARGRQAAKIIVVQDPDELAGLERLNAAVLGSPAAHPFYGAPTVCVVLADPSVNTAVEDGALVIGNMLAAAHSLGLGACWIHRAREVFDSAEGKALLQKWGVQGSYIGVGHCVLGYPAGRAQGSGPA